MVQKSTYSIVWDLGARGGGGVKAVDAVCKQPPRRDKVVASTGRGQNLKSARARRPI